MQRVAAYRLERHLIPSGAQGIADAYERCLVVLIEWLRYKGADNPDAANGSYSSRDGGIGTFAWEEAYDETRRWKLLRLDEVAPDGRRHLAAVSVTNTGNDVIVYVTIEAGLSSSAVVPIHIDPRCPRVVRELLKLPVNWFHGATPLLKCHAVKGFDAGQTLATTILDAARTIPVITISAEEMEPAVPGLAKQVSFDLEGLTNVCVVDVDAAWALTALLGRRPFLPFRCGTHLLAQIHLGGQPFPPSPLDGPTTPSERPRPGFHT